MSKGKKPLHDGEIFCPHCEKPVHIRIERHVIVPAEKAEYEIRVFVEKSGAQTRLDET